MTWYTKVSKDISYIPDAIAVQSNVDLETGELLENE